MQKENIVLFSSGVSEENGVLFFLTQNLQALGYNCCYWRDLFKNSRNQDQIALLPMLIKKIPTFDYAVLICEGHDTVEILKEGRINRLPTMRDNVLFEIGLCVTALGLNRVILVTDSIVRMPDDLQGKNGNIALKQFVYTHDKYSVHETPQQAERYIMRLKQVAAEIDSYICNNGNALSPVVIGAASSIACGYVNNYIFRTLEWIDEGIIYNNGKGKAILRFPVSKVYMHIFLPGKLSQTSSSQSEIMQKNYEKAKSVKSRIRSATFYFEIIQDELHILDFPTTVSTSYDTAKMILNIDADDDTDSEAQCRFTNKELNLFEATVRNLLSKEYLKNTLEQNYPNESEEVLHKVFDNVYDIILNRLTIERFV